MIELEHVFDALLTHRPDMEPIVDAEGRDGELIGSGDGEVRGPLVNGRLRWSFYEQVDATTCRTNPGAEILTDDGARIAVDARGYGLRGFDPGRSHVWSMASALVFRTDDRRYAWLDRAVGLWHGEFDERAGSATYRAWIRKEATR